jgi:hypothetical protein
LVAFTGQVDAATTAAFRQAASGFGVTILVGTRAGGSSGAPARVGRAFITIDASSQPFPTAWNTTILQWHLAATPRYSHSQS